MWELRAVKGNGQHEVLSLAADMAMPYVGKRHPTLFAWCL